MSNPERHNARRGGGLEGEYLSRAQVVSQEARLRVLSRAESIVDEAVNQDSLDCKKRLVAMSAAASNLWDQMTTTDGFMGYPEETPLDKEGGYEPLSEVTARWLALAALALPQTVENQYVLDRIGYVGSGELRDEQARYNTTLVNAFARLPSGMGLEDFRAAIWRMMPAGALRDVDLEAYEHVLNKRTKGMLAEQQVISKLLANRTQLVIEGKRFRVESAARSDDARGTDVRIVHEETGSVTRVNVKTPNGFKLALGKQKVTQGDGKSGWFRNGRGVYVVDSEVFLQEPLAIVRQLTAALR